jgi:hypothetical protein
MRHESVDSHFRVCFVQHKRTCVFSVQPSQSNACAEVLPSDVFFQPCFVDVETKPVGHVVCEGHAPPIHWMDMSASVVLMTNRTIAGCEMQSLDAWD